jgi:hypothetical protein
MEQLTTGSPTMISAVPNSSSPRRQPPGCPSLSDSFMMGLTYYEVTWTREVDKISEEARHSKDPCMYVCIYILSLYLKVGAALNLHPRNMKGVVNLCP